MMNLTWHQQRAAGLHALPYDIVGYSWHASSYCPTCIIERLIANGYASPGARGMNAEEVLDQIAEANAIDRVSEETFDSGDFPKVIFRDSAESYQDELGQAEACGSCWEVLA